MTLDMLASPESKPCASDVSAISLAYLVSSYPAVSMAWLLREVIELRRLGLTIQVAAVNVPDRSTEEMTSDEAREVDSTYYLKRHGIRGGITAHTRGLIRYPGGYLRGLSLVLTLGSLDLRRLTLNLMYFTEALMVGLWMRRLGLKHLHVHLASQAATVGLYVHRVFGIDYSITVHGPDEFFDVGGQYLAHKLAAASFICCISNFARSQLMRLVPPSYWSKLLLARLGVDHTVFAPPRLPKTGVQTSILCVGRLIPTKGQYLLIDAVERLVIGGRNVQLILVGGGPDLFALKARASNSVTPNAFVFKGALNQNQILDIYRTADIFCLPSFAEGIPVVLMEAMAMQIACVSTFVAGIPELIRNGVDGMLVPAADVDALTAALAKLVDDPEFRACIAAHGRMRVVESYNLVRNVAALASIFGERVAAT